MVQEVVATKMNVSSQTEYNHLDISKVFGAVGRIVGSLLLKTT